MKTPTASLTLMITLLFLGLSAPTALTAESKKPAAKEKAEASAKTTLLQPDDLPEPVRQMMEDLRAAAAAGDLTELRDLFETNELAPVLDDEHVSEPIGHWKSKSIDGSARDIMAILTELLARPAVKTKGGDFLWPYFAATPLEKLNPEQQVDLFRLVGPSLAVEMLKNKRYSHYELEIGKDGTWHFFKKSATKPDAKTGNDKKPE